MNHIIWFILYGPYYTEHMIKIRFSMSLVWTFTVIVPYFRGQNYINSTCKLVGLNGVPWRCQNESYFADIKFDHKGKYKAGRYCPKEQQNCDQMMDEDNCIAFYVEDDVGKRHILHEDEVDIGKVYLYSLVGAMELLNWH